MSIFVPKDPAAAVAEAVQRMQSASVLLAVQIADPVPGEVNATLECGCGAADWFPWRFQGRLRAHCRRCGFDHAIRPRMRV